MKFFTPELYAAFGSADDATADRADEAWESALGEYRRHLKKIGRHLPPEARRIAEKLCFHDANYIGFEVAPDLAEHVLGGLSSFDAESPDARQGDSDTSANGAAGVGFLLVEQERRIQLLLYRLRQQPTFTRPLHSSVFSNERPHWLYDEFDWVNGTCQHQILLSTGTVLTLQFTACDVISIPSAVGLQTGLAATP